MKAEPCFDIAHLGHVELLTDRPEASLDFFVNVFGLTESGREGGSVYLRGWDDYEFHSLKLTASGTTGMAHAAYRATSQAALERQVAREVDFTTFFAEAPAMNPQREFVTGVVCGVRVEEVEDPLMRQIRILDKLVDELAKGKALEKVLRAADG